MSIDKRWILLLAVTASAAVSAVFFRRSQHRAAHELQNKTNLKAWENEGGNLAPTAVAPAQP